MPYRQYTQCVNVNNHRGLASYIGVGGLGSVVAALTLLASGAGLLAVVTIPLLMLLIAYCHWWLYDRLICLGGDRCVIGMLLSTEPPEEKSGFEAFDSDYSINLVLAPHLIWDTKTKIEDDGLQGFLIKEQSTTHDAGLGFTGYTSKQWGNYPDTPVLHCEFEGGSIYKLYDALKIALALMTAAAIGSAFCWLPIIGWIACAVAAVLAIAALAALAIGIGVALNDKASPADVNPDLGTFVTNDATGLGADLLVVKGEWVYDSGHEGWNEIHPIRHCQKIGKWYGRWDFDTKIALKSWCEAINIASSALTIKNQQKPENQWEIHPMIDGCETSQKDEGTPIIK